MTTDQNADDRLMLRARRAARIDIADLVAGTVRTSRSGHRYVVLYDHVRTVAVYRIGNDGGLRRLKRWPREIDEYVT